VADDPQAQHLSARGPLRVDHALDLATHVDTDLPLGEWTHVTQPQIDRFVALTNDPNWIHTDAGRMASTYNGAATIVPGQLLLSLLPGLLRDVYVVGKGRGLVAGMRAVRFRKPVHPGDDFRLHARLILVQQNPAFVRVETACRLQLKSGQSAVTAQRTDIFYAD